MASSPKVWTPVEPRGHSGNRSPDRPYHAGQVTDRRALSIGAGNDPGALFCEPVSHRAVAPSASSRPRHRAALGRRGNSRLLPWATFLTYLRVPIIGAVANCWLICWRNGDGEGLRSSFRPRNLYRCHLHSLRTPCDSC